MVNTMRTTFWYIRVKLLKMKDKKVISKLHKGKEILYFQISNNKMDS